MFTYEDAVRSTRPRRYSFARRPTDLELALKSIGRPSMRMTEEAKKIGLWNSSDLNGGHPIARGCPFPFGCFSGSSRKGNYCRNFERQASLTCTTRSKGPAMKILIAAAGITALTLAGAMAQSSGGGGGTSGGASSGSGTSGTAGAGGSAAQPGTSSSGRTGPAVPNPALNPNPAAPGQSAVPSPIPGSNQSATPGSASGQGDLGTQEQGQTGVRATNRGGMPDPSPNTQKQPNSPIEQSEVQKNQQSGGGSSRREGAAGSDMQSCMKAWDTGTHMTKAQWRRVCANTLSDRKSLLR